MRHAPLGVLHDLGLDRLVRGEVPGLEDREVGRVEAGVEPGEPLVEQRALQRSAARRQLALGEAIREERQEGVVLVDDGTVEHHHGHGAVRIQGEERRAGLLGSGDAAEPVRLLQPLEDDQLGQRAGPGSVVEEDFHAAGRRGVRRFGGR